MQTKTSNTLHNAIMEAGGKDRPPMLAPDNEVPISEGSSVTTTETYMETYKNVSQDIHDQLNAEAEAVQIILTGIDNDIYSTVDVVRMHEFGKFTSQDGESLESCYLRFYKMMNELIRNQCDVTNHQVNAQFLLQLQPEWQRAERIAHTANPLALVAQQQPDKEIDKLMALISLSFKKIYKPTNKNLRTSSNFSRANQDNSLRINRSTGYENQRIDEHNVVIDSLDISYDREQIDQNDDDDDLVNERELLASLIEKLKCEIDDNKNHNKFLETSNKVLVEKLKGEIKDFKNKNKSFESSNNPFKEANNKLSETNKLLYNDFKKSQAELERCNDVGYASKVKIDCAKEMKKKLCAHQETIFILSQAKEAQFKLYKTREDKELDKVIALENKVKVLDNIIYKTDQSVQTMNMLNNNVERVLQNLSSSRKLKERILI
nr:hypothetical protein [Tanacetum cinerariifolium]